MMIVCIKILSLQQQVIIRGSKCGINAYLIEGKPTTHQIVQKSVYYLQNVDDNTITVGEITPNTITNNPKNVEHGPITVYRTCNVEETP
ncbi:MAG: hypothetical protein K6E86_07535 [Bacteroidales bacterium]|nr:hypothetical protein [Bacteroidales bacterium]